MPIGVNLSKNLISAGFAAHITPSIPLGHVFKLIRERCIWADPPCLSLSKLCLSHIFLNTLERLMK
jgi:hypothetical protein